MDKEIVSSLLVQKRQAGVIYARQRCGIIFQLLRQVEFAVVDRA